MPAAGLPVIPGFTLIEILGSGGMGIVYKARQVRLDRLVAIKIMRTEYLAEATLIERFQREARAVARLSHPHIVTLHDADEVNGLHFLVMEYVEGTDLGQFVAEKGPLSSETAARLLVQAALALQHAHGHSLVHRDIKPSNLLVTSGKGLGASEEKSKTSPLATSHQPLATLKLLDFGLARFREAIPGASVTSADQLVGSPDFIAPEQIEDPHAADIRSDLYSLGCTFYYAVTGAVPFPARAVMDKLDGHRFQTPVPVQKRRPDVLPELAAAINRLMRRRPEDRYVAPSELAAELSPFLQAVQTQGTQPTVAGAESPKTRRFTAHADWVMSVGFSPDGERIISAGRDGSIAVWQATSGREVFRWQAHEGAIPCVNFLPSGRHILSGGEDGTIRLWTSDTGRQKRALTGHHGAVYGFAVFPDGRRALSAGEDQTIRLWNLTTGRQSRLIGGTVAERHWDAVLCVAVTADGKRAISGSRDSTARIWDIEANREERCLRGHPGPVCAVALTSDGRHALTASCQQLRLWDMTTGEVVRLLPEQDKPIRTIALSPDGRLLATGGEDRTVRLWDMATGELFHHFDGAASWVLSVAFSPDGRHIVAGGADRCVCVWEAPMLTSVP
jgi:eukaryotic-like serine/threonine-protein kinase